MVPESPEVSTRPPTSQSGMRDPKDLDINRRSLSTPRGTNMQDFEPIVERGPLPDDSARRSGGATLFSSLLDSADFEPIVERGASSQAVAPAPAAPRPPPLMPGKSLLPPPRPPEQTRAMAAAASDLGPRLTMDYFRQVGVRTSWRPGDTAYWRGQECKVVRVVTEDQPLYVVIQTPSCAEVTTDLCLLSEVPPNGQVVGALRTPADAADNGRPLRLAPLGDLLLDRPQALDRAPAPVSERTALTERHIANQPVMYTSQQSFQAPGSPDKTVPRSASLPARGLSPVRVPSRQNSPHQRQYG